MNNQKKINQLEQTAYYTKQSEAFKICKHCNKHLKSSEIILHQIKCKILSKIGKQKKKQELIPKHQENIQLMQIPQQKIPCTYCGYEQSLKELDVHPSQCLFQKTICPFCQEPYPLELMTQHIQICDKQQNQKSLKEQDQQQFFKVIEYLKIGKQKQICSICYKPFQFKKELIKFKCDHYFHPQCIYPWFQQDHFNCFICKK